MTVSIFPLPPQIQLMPWVLTGALMTCLLLPQMQRSAPPPPLRQDI